MSMTYSATSWSHFCWQSVQETVVAHLEVRMKVPSTKSFSGIGHYQVGEQRGNG
jgi:hypothetical protein